MVNLAFCGRNSEQIAYHLRSSKDKLEVKLQNAWLSYFFVVETAHYRVPDWLCWLNIESCSWGSARLWEPLSAPLTPISKAFLARQSAIIAFYADLFSVNAGEPRAWALSCAYRCSNGVWTHADKGSFGTGSDLSPEAFVPLSLAGSEAAAGASFKSRCRIASTHSQLGPG